MRAAGAVRSVLISGLLAALAEGRRARDGAGAAVVGVQRWWGWYGVGVVRGVGGDAGAGPCELRTDGPVRR
ncbi:hypothetical protein GCM10010495_00160 [Kitasatospora herbaricolor]|nr:hypothetical protein GCM10010495_00160 [Kitasatospora herbaricolor]